MADVKNFTPLEQAKSSSSTKKILLMGGIIGLVLSLGLSIMSVRKPNTTLTEAQTNSDVITVEKCLQDGGFQTDLITCQNEDSDVIGTIGDGSGGDSGSVTVCCRPKSLITPISCPDDSTFVNIDECPPGSRVIVDGGDGIGIPPDKTCCKKSPTPSPTPGDCTPEPPTVKVDVECPTCITNPE